MHQIPRQYKELIDTLWNVNENVIVLVGFAMEN